MATRTLEGGEGVKGSWSSHTMTSASTQDAFPKLRIGWYVKNLATVCAAQKKGFQNRNSQGTVPADAAPIFGWLHCICSYPVARGAEVRCLGRSLSTIIRSRVQPPTGRSAPRPAQSHRPRRVDHVGPHFTWVRTQVLPRLPLTQRADPSHGVAWTGYDAG